MFWPKLQPSYWLCTQKGFENPLKGRKPLRRCHIGPDPGSLSLRLRSTAPTSGLRPIRRRFPRTAPAARPQHSPLPAHFGTRFSRQQPGNGRSRGRRHLVEALARRHPGGLVRGSPEVRPRQWPPPACRRRGPPPVRAPTAPARSTGRTRQSRSAIRSAALGPGNGPSHSRAELFGPEPQGVGVAFFSCRRRRRRLLRAVRPLPARARRRDGTESSRTSTPFHVSIRPT